MIQWVRQNQTNPQILISSIDCYGVAMGKNGFIYVSEYKKNEETRWKEGDSKGSVAFGGSVQGEEPNQLCFPEDVSFDVETNLYVVDTYKHRTLKYELCIE
ncbi:unnamed protein product [Adineta steineri]|uniref:Uncharacterized protein n=1 Tax=Adineta steineri TaxID=433720 RepID=A0A813X2F4_9BILA|nr:unnamed protein product [Adineta steineri]CAF1528932.1 unnamed protein product [Adineta steineri]CAF3803699.1 unnamed protein product [Adineta steineri]